jgi:hypothetical protein
MLTPTSFMFRPTSYGAIPGKDLVDDLWMHAWVPPERHGVSDLDACSRTIDSYEGEKLVFPFTVVYFPPRARSTLTPSNNSHLTNGLGTTWLENVLVIKHDAADHPIDMHEGDVEKATAVVRW